MFNPLTFLSQMLMGGVKPEQIIQNLVKQNPQAQVLINQMQQSGMTPQQFVQQYAKQNNIDLNNNVVMNMMKNKGIKF